MRCTPVHNYTLLWILSLFLKVLWINDLVFSVCWESRLSIWRACKWPINYKLRHSAEFFKNPACYDFSFLILKTLFESHSFLTSSIHLLFYYSLVTLWFTSYQHLQLKDIGTVGDYKTYGQPWKQGQELKQSYVFKVLYKLKQICILLFEADWAMMAVHTKDFCNFSTYLI